MREAGGVMRAKILSHVLREQNSLGGFALVIARNRQAHLLHACLSETIQPGT
jgi:hypothetical protein